MKIGKRASAKKYESLREKQAKANALVLESRKRLGSKHKEIQKITKMKKLFFGKRGVRASGRLSFKNLSTKDIQAYNEFLDAIINAHETNTYLNPVKYDNMRAKLEKSFNDQYGDIGITPDELVDIVESDIVAQLKELGIPYKEVFELFRDYPEMRTEDVILALKVFKDIYDEGSTTADDFLVFVDDFLQLSQTPIFDNFEMDEVMRAYESLPDHIRNINDFTDIMRDYNEGEYGSIEGYIDYVSRYL